MNHLKISKCSEQNEYFPWAVELENVDILFWYRTACQTVFRMNCFKDAVQFYVLLYYA